MSHRDISGTQRANARRMRAEMTEAERRLWSALRGHRFGAVQFRRQVPIGPYIADFCCHSARLVVEVDGGQHGTASGSAHDTRRDAAIAAEGYRVLRFWNHEVLAETEAVLTVVWTALIESGAMVERADTPLPVPPPQGGRGRRLRRSREISSTEPEARSNDGTLELSPRVPSPLVGEGQGGGCAAPANFSETRVSRPFSTAASDGIGDSNQGPTP